MTVLFPLEWDDPEEAALVAAGQTINIPQSVPITNYQLPITN